jgi:hypothetical protein
MKKKNEMEMSRRVLLVEKVPRVTAFFQGILAFK